MSYNIVIVVNSCQNASAKSAKIRPLRKILDAMVLCLLTAVQ